MCIWCYPHEQQTFTKPLPSINVPLMCIMYHHVVTTKPSFVMVCNTMSKSTTCTHAPHGMMPIHGTKPCDCAIMGIKCYHTHKPPIKKYLPKSFIRNINTAAHNDGAPHAKCVCCHVSFIMPYMNYGTTTQPSFQSPKHWCNDCVPHDFMAS